MTLACGVVGTLVPYSGNWRLRAPCVERDTVGGECANSTGGSAVVE